MRRPPFMAVLAGAALLLGGAACRRVPLADGTVPCLHPPRVAEELRDQVRELVTTTDPDERARRDAYGLQSVTPADVRVEEDRAACTRAALAVAAEMRAVAPETPVRPVALVRAGSERFVAVDPTPDPRSEWRAALVFTRDFNRRVGAFAF